MNERYKKIAEKAGFMLWGDEDWNPGDVVDWSMKYDQQLEKFAELIVVDVINRAERYGLGCDAVEQLKEDFGVEE